MKVCVIPARGGSKRIPKKNIKSFLGKPIIAYSIEAALISNCFDKVIVSTDSDEIASVAEEFGAEVPFMRPDELSDDYTATLPVMRHAISWLVQNSYSPSVACCIYATAPFVTPSNLESSYRQLLETNADYCISVASFGHPIQRALKLNQKRLLGMFFEQDQTVRSQDLIQTYHDAGQFYWGRVEAFLAEIPFFSDRASPFILPRFLVEDIDTAEDWNRAEVLHQLLKQTGRL